jgi:hypothetical protein
MLYMLCIKKELDVSKILESKEIMIYLFLDKAMLENMFQQLLQRFYLKKKKEVF